MQIRDLAGWKRLLMALVAIASLITAPAGAAVPMTSGSSSTGSPTSVGGVGQQPDEELPGVEPVLYQRTNYVWPFASGPVYGSVPAESWSASGVLHTPVGSFDLRQGFPNLPNELRAVNRLDTGVPQYFVLQVKNEALADGSFDDVKRLIADQGGAIVNEMPVSAFVVRLTAGAFDVIKGSPAIQALQPYQPAFKLSPEIGRVPLLDAARATSSVYSLRLRLFPGEAPVAVTASLEALGLHVTKEYADTVFVDADRSKLAAIAAIDAVSDIGEVLPIFLMSEETTSTVQTGRWNNGATPYTDAGVDGGGADKVSLADDQILMIIDNGIQLDNGDLSNSRVDGGYDGQSEITDPANGAVIANHRKVAFYGTTSPFTGSGDLLGCDGGTTSGVTHGHTVAAVALGNATRVSVGYGAGWTAVDPAGNFWDLDGLAPKARLIAYDGQVTPLTGRCDDVTQIVGGSPLDVGDLYTAPSTGSLPASYAKGARIANFSWGTVANGSYDDNAKDIDAFLNATSDAMVFVASGNTGRDKDANRVPDPNTIGPPGTAKNIICVGASRNADDLGIVDLQNTRWVNSSNGPATGPSKRIAPLVMAPGTDAGTLGLASEFHCRSNDNDQFNNVECDVIPGQVSTSFASAAAAGAGLIVRDYFAQGFYPDGTNTNTNNNTDKVATISGPLLKAILVASAQWMGPEGSNLPYAPNLTRAFRGNREQGYGRIQLSNVLPLSTYPGAVSGLIVGDGGPAPAGLVNNTTLDLTLDPAQLPTTTTINVCDTSQPLTVVIAWNDPGNASDGITRDLDLELQGPAPNNRKYLGNVFTDDLSSFRDNTDDNEITGTEECTYNNVPWPPNFVNTAVDTGPWSIPVSASAGGTVSCTNVSSHADHFNNVEGIFLSPDAKLNGTFNDTTTLLDEAADNQIEQGQWTITVKSTSGTGNQPYSIAIAGGLCKGSQVRIRRVLEKNQLGGNTLTCNDSAVVTINEVDATGDIAPTTAKVAARTKLEVLDANGNVTDTETLTAADFPPAGVTSAGGNYRFDSKKILLTDGTVQESGNGVLDVRDGHRIRVTYQDVGTDSTPDLNAKREAVAQVSCQPVLAAGGIVFGQFGKDAFTLVDGGCEKDKRGYFTFGFPDKYMDEGELVQYVVAFQSAEPSTDLVNVSISLRAVTADPDSPASCKPGTTSCADPNRTNNVTSPLLTVLDSPKIYGRLPAGAQITPSFTIQVANGIAATTHKVDMIIGVTAKSAGKGVEALIVQREVMNADEFSLYYSTDFPLGGTESVGGYDINNNEILETVTNDPALFTNDYYFETRSYSNMTATNPLVDLHAPWNFDTNNGGFVNGLNNTSRPSAGTYVQWGEDKNFNGLLDGFCTGDTTIPCSQDSGVSEGCKRCSLNKGHACSVDPNCLPSDGTCIPHGTCDFGLDEDRGTGLPNGDLDSGWGTGGGCGWQTKNPGDPTGGVWHTGFVRSINSLADCIAPGNFPGDCQSYYAQPDLDYAGDNNWWDMLLTPVLHKVNQGLDGSGDPVYQVAITNWAWNMEVDIPDTNTSVTVEFDTDTNKVQGVDLFNDAAVLFAFRGRQGAVSGGNAPITGGFNLFAPVNNCVDTDGNGVKDHCGSVTGALCNSVKKQPDNECLGWDIGATDDSGSGPKVARGLCSIPPAQLRCTGNPNLGCTTDAHCNQRCSLNDLRGCQSPVQPGSGAAGPTNNCVANGPLGLSADGTCADQVAALGMPPPGEKCVAAPAACQYDSDCSGIGQGVCVAVGGTGNNREGNNNCLFEGMQDPGPNQVVTAQVPYGLATPPDDDAANGFCNRNDSLNGIDKSIPCIGTRECDNAGDPYATVRSCSLATTRICEKNAGCNACSLLTTKTCLTNADCFTGEGTCSLALFGTCTNTVYASVCNKPKSCSVKTCVGGPQAGLACASSANCSGNVCTETQCLVNADCLPNGGTCTGAVTVDEFVQKNGPGRNYGIQFTNGPDMRFTTLEDFYGDTGTAFRGAVGFNNREPDSNTSGIAPGFGAAIDDMVVTWKETRLDVDSTSCAGSGECATLDSSSTVAYEGNSVVSLTVTDKTPYGGQFCNGAGFTNKPCLTNADCTVGQGTCAQGNLVNNCNGDRVCSQSPGTSCLVPTDCTAAQGTCVDDYTDAGDDTDCNNNGTLDVTVRLTSDAEVTGEIAILDKVAGQPIYQGNAPFSTFYNSPGTLFIVQSGTTPPIVKSVYDDRNDGTGARCSNALEPSVRGFIVSNTTIAATAGRVTVNSYKVQRVSVCTLAPGQQCTTGPDTCGANGPCDTAHGDDDGFADTNELCNLVVVFANKSGLDVEDLSATLGTDSPNIECITRSALFVPGIFYDQTLSNPATYLPFQFKVANVNRTSLEQVLQAKFTITVRSNKFDQLTRATDILLDLDLSATGGGGANANNLLYEDFEAGFGKFTREFLDANKTSLTASNGFRCQYNDPLGLNSNSATNANCFLGFTSDPSTGVNDWHVHDTSLGPNGASQGRAFSGTKSLHLGVHQTTPDRDTTRLRHIMSARSTTPVFLGLAGVNPELNFAQQVSFVDASAGVNVSPGEGVDRGVVEIKTTVLGSPWIKIYPYVNVYDQQGTDDFSNCVFDPTDDGNNEDSFFDPTDPQRRLGPSSTCYPEFTFVHQGQTDWRKIFDVTDVGNASDGPGLQGCSTPGVCLPANLPPPAQPNNPGTWVRPRFSLVSQAGRSILMRFLFSSIEVGATDTMFGFFGRGNISGDDGWYIDDIRLDGTVTSAITVFLDNTAIASPLVCGACSNVTPVLTAIPNSLSAPGQIVTLSAKDSTIDLCKNGVAQFQFWNNANGNGIVGDGGDTLLRDWTDNSTYVDAPLLPTSYGLKVRCSTDTACDAAGQSVLLPVSVTCPTAGILQVDKTLNAAGSEPENNVTVSWGSSLTVDVFRGDLGALRSSLGVTNVETSGCLLDGVGSSTGNPTSAAPYAPATPQLLEASYYLLRSTVTGACNLVPNSYREPGLSPPVIDSPGTGGGGLNRDGDVAADADRCLP